MSKSIIHPSIPFPAIAWKVDSIIHSRLTIGLLVSASVRRLRYRLQPRLSLNWRIRMLGIWIRLGAILLWTCVDRLIGIDRVTGTGRGRSDFAT